MQTEKIIDHIVSWLEEYAHFSRTNGFVLGVSGGLDSAVVSTLCAKTQLPTLCVELPIHQVQDHVDRAKEHIQFLQDNFSNVHTSEIDLTPVFDQFVTQLPSTGKPEITDLALANSRSRLRMTTLYYFAQIHGYLVAGTGNKIEDFGVGFFTKYGDGGVDISPIGDLMKSEVYKIGSALGIPQSIIQAVPTDGLFGDDRSDEDQLGATYSELEWAMTTYEQGGRTEQFNDREQEVLKIFERLNKVNQHKMKPIPVCIIPKIFK